MSSEREKEKKRGQESELYCFQVEGTPCVIDFIIFYKQSLSCEASYNEFDGIQNDAIWDPNAP